MPIAVTLIHAPKGVKPIVARERAVRGVAQLARVEHPKRIVFELDEAVDREDRRWLRSELGANSPVEYLHQNRSADPMVWIADGIAWAVQRGGQWCAQVEPLITQVIKA